MQHPDSQASSSIAAPHTDAHGDFAGFYRAHYIKLVKIALTVGATLDEVEDVVNQTMEEVLRRWGELKDPFAYARRALGTNLIKTQQREREGHRRMIRAAQRDRQPADDCQLNVWEDREWVCQLLESLPPAQREVMALTVDGVKPTEIAELLGKTPETIRKNLQHARYRLQRQLRTPQGIKKTNEGGGTTAAPNGKPAARKEVR